MAQQHMHWIARTFACAVVFAFAATIPAPARAQGTGRSMDIDLSIRSAAMGGASNALSWGDLNYWGNPALLGYAEGVRYIHTHTQLVPGLANDVFLNSDVVELGAGGAGVVLSGRPFETGGVRLDYGQSEGRDDSGNPTGTFGSWETVKSIGAGASAMRMLESFVQLASGRDLGLSRFGDVSVGASSKHVVIARAPTAAGGTGRTTARDWGYHARLTPIDGFRGRGQPPIRIDLAYGYSILSYNDDAIVVLPNEDQASPVTRHHRRGGAGQIALGRLPVPSRPPAGALGRAFLEGLSPLVSFTQAVDHAKLGGGSAIQYVTDGSGFELTVANLYTFRRGHYEDLSGDIDGDTWGWGVGLPLGKLGGARYDDAHNPQAQHSGLGAVHRSQFTAWVDPVAVWRLAHGRK